MGIILLRIDFPMQESDIVGSYVNKNYSNEPCCVEAPHIADTLVLMADKTFTSGFYGSGTYKISYENSYTTRIEWEYEMGAAGYNTYFSNELFEKPKIILNYDMNHYYEKLK
ncbi:hypothetical protein BH10BAC1_BH10BAC1_00370 [soil metagenome]